MTQYIIHLFLVIWLSLMVSACGIMAIEALGLRCNPMGIFVVTILCSAVSATIILAIFGGGVR